ncbi:MAG: type II toxin-antitoxin system VapC family toxin [Crenarchaeota archaeon]|nr:type II toxin-antitoxin system VapC family toxin [Thermoproteota archaeon]
MSVLERYENILLDPTALIVLHSREYKEFIPIIVAKLNAYTTIFSIIEYLSLISYYGRKPGKTIIDRLKEIYNIAEITNETMIKAASIRSDLLRHGVRAELQDIIHVAICKEKGLILVTGDPERYEPMKKYGIEIIHIGELINIIKRILDQSKQV